MLALDDQLYRVFLQETGAIITGYYSGRVGTILIKLKHDCIHKYYLMTEWRKKNSAVSHPDS